MIRKVFPRCEIFFLNSKLKHHIVRRNLWGYVSIAFNRVDTYRLREVGADRLCAEWLLKNGGSIRTTAAPHKLWTDYNSLPPENVKFHIKVADGSDASIMKIGFDHFAGCRHIDTVILHNCRFLESGCIKYLRHISRTLDHLEITSCDDIRDCDIEDIAMLSNLSYVLLRDLRAVDDLDSSVSKLQDRMPNCHIES